MDDTHNQTSTSDEQQTPVPRTSNSIEMLKRKSSSNTNSSLSSTSTPASPVGQQKCHSRSSSSSSISNSSHQKKAKLNDDANNNRSLNDLSQFVQLNKEERNVQPSSVSNEKDKTTVTNKSNTSNKDPKFVFKFYFSIKEKSFCSKIVL